MSQTYAAALHAALKDADTTRLQMGRNREDIEAAIASITSALKGPLPDAERIWLCADRRELRNALIALDAASASRT